MKMLVMLGAARPDWADETPEHWCWWSSSSARRVLRRWSESQAMRAFIQLEVGTRSGVRAVPSAAMVVASKACRVDSDTHVIEGHTCSSCSGRLRLMRLRVPAPCLYVKQRTNKAVSYLMKKAAESRQAGLLCASIFFKRKKLLARN